MRIRPLTSPNGNTRRGTAETASPNMRGVRRSLTPEQRREILQQLFFEGAARGPFVRQFYILLALSTVSVRHFMPTQLPE